MVRNARKKQKLIDSNSFQKGIDLIEDVSPKKRRALFAIGKKVIDFKMFNNSLESNRASPAAVYWPVFGDLEKVMHYLCSTRPETVCASHAVTFDDLIREIHNVDVKALDHVRRSLSGRALHTSDESNPIA